jgi:hypothetical protein
VQKTSGFSPADEWPSEATKASVFLAQAVLNQNLNGAVEAITPPVEQKNFGLNPCVSLVVSENFHNLGANFQMAG